MIHKRRFSDPLVRKLLTLTLLLGASLGAVVAPSSVPSEKSVTTAPAVAPPVELPDSDKVKEDSDEATSATTESTKAADAGSTTDDVSPADSAVAGSLDKVDPPHFEFFVPSVRRVGKAAQKSRTAELVEALSGLFPQADPILGEEDKFDPKVLLEIGERMLEWPDTSIRLTTYSQDRDGRPRWALSTDWPLEDLVDRVRSIIEDEKAKALFENMALVKDEDGSYRLELPDLVLAYLAPSDGEGSIIKATQSLRVGADLFGVKESKGGSSRQTLVFSRLNLNVDDESEKNPLLSSVVGLDTIDYELRLNKDGRWRETFIVQWNALVGVALKAVFQKTKNTFECPADAYVNAVLNLGAVSQSAADGLAGLPVGTIGGRAGGDLGFSVVPGTGFLPFPDMYYQFRVASKDALIKSIRKAIENDKKTRERDERRIAWYEEEVDGQVVFWRDPSADRQSYGVMPVTYRSVIFFQDAPVKDDESDSEGEENAESLLIIANTSNWHDDAVNNWKKCTAAKTYSMPSTNGVDWQGLIRWKQIYELLHPYMVLVIGTGEDRSLPPEPEALDSALANSRVDIKIGVSGFYARHVGPVPIGAGYNPAVVGATLSTTAAASSEITRERIACQRLRILHHHSKLFAKDFGRWPANVAELDGYIDFASHPQLLSIRPQQSSFMKEFVSIFTAEQKDDEEAENVELDDDRIDDSLYVIDWSENKEDWRLKFRDGEFKSYKTIAINAEGEIERIPLSDEKSSDDDRKVASSEKVEYK